MATRRTPFTPDTPEQIAAAAAITPADVERAKEAFKRAARGAGKLAEILDATPLPEAGE